MLLIEATKKKGLPIQEIIFSGSLIIVSGLLINLGNVLTIVLPYSNKSILNLFLLFIFGTIGFIVVPYLLVRKMNEPSEELMLKRQIKLKRSILLFSLLLLLGLFLTDPVQTLHPFIIATGEEFLFRFIIYYVLRKRFSKLESFVIGSLLFSIVLHLNGNLLFNFFTKFPMSLLLYYLSDKYGLQDSIALHWLNNLLVSKFL